MYICLFYDVVDQSNRILPPSQDLFCAAISSDNLSLTGLFNFILSDLVFYLLVVHTSWFHKVNRPDVDLFLID